MNNQNTDKNNPTPAVSGPENMATPQVQPAAPVSPTSASPMSSNPTPATPDSGMPSSSSASVTDPKSGDVQNDTTSSGGKGKYVMMGLVVVFLIATAVLGYVYWTTQNNTTENTQNSQTTQTPATNNAITVTEGVPTDASQVDLGSIDSDLNSIDSDLNQLNSSY